MLKSATLVLSLAMGATLPLHAAPAHKILFFSKSSGFEHSVISWKDGKPSVAEKVFLELGTKNTWTFEFSKDGSKFSKEYLAQFDTVIFYTTGDLTTTGTDGQPAMSPEGKKALFDYVKGGKGFIGIHCASDTFHTKPDSKIAEDRHHLEESDTYIDFLGGEFITHGDQQTATNKVIDPSFPGFKTLGESFSWNEEWYALKHFNPDIHVLTVIDSPAMKGDMYKRPPFPTTWARKEGKGRVFYTAMGHRDDVWANPGFQEILMGAIRWTTGDAMAGIEPNLKKVAPEASKHP